MQYHKESMVGVGNPQDMCQSVERKGILLCMHALVKGLGLHDHNKD